jgi:hypothetical protein
VRHRIYMSVDVDARDGQEAHQWAIKLEALLQQPFVRMTLEGDGIRLVDDGHVIVYTPQPR